MLRLNAWEEIGWHSSTIPLPLQFHSRTQRQVRALQAQLPPSRICKGCVSESPGGSKSQDISKTPITVSLVYAPLPKLRRILPFGCGLVIVMVCRLFVMTWRYFKFLLPWGGFRPVYLRELAMDFPIFYEKFQRAHRLVPKRCNGQPFLKSKPVGPT